MLAMAVRYLFDSGGRWIAFASGKFVFGRHGDPLGWIPWDDNDNEVVTKGGDYFGTIVGRAGRQRLYRFRHHPYRGYPGRPSDPDYPGYPGHPGAIDRTLPPFGAEDIDLRSLVSEV